MSSHILENIVWKTLDWIMKMWQNSLIWNNFKKFIICIFGSHTRNSNPRNCRLSQYFTEQIREFCFFGFCRIWTSSSCQIYSSNNNFFSSLRFYFLNFLDNFIQWATNMWSSFGYSKTEWTVVIASILNYEKMLCVYGRFSSDFIFKSILWGTFWQ